MVDRRQCLMLPALGLPLHGISATSLPQAMQRARVMRAQALQSGDQSFGAVVLRGDQIVGEAPSRVVTSNDPTAHAEVEAIRDASRRLGSRDLSGCTLVSTSRPCRMCEAAAAWARIDRMVHGDGLTDAGAQPASTLGCHPLAVPNMVAIGYAALSAVCFLAYAIDKHSAKSGGWRTKESTLLLLGLVGGWPGGMLAQQFLRHKSIKTSFRVAFWFTVALNVIAFVALSSPRIGAWGLLRSTW